MHSERTIAGCSLSLLWIANVAALIGMAAWIYLDPRVAPHLAQQEYALAANFHDALPSPEPIDAYDWRWLLVTLIACLVLSSILVLTVALFAGPRERRGLRSWLGLTMLTALWLGLAVSWRDISWAGTRSRVAPLTAAFRPLVITLRKDWPTRDDTIPGIGYFSAYPVGKPSMLMIIAVDPQAPSAPVSAVERSPQGALRFQLAGRETDAWLEWHPVGSKPESFTGGLEEPHELERFSQLSSEWFAVRYSPSYTCIEQPPAAALTPAK